MYRTRTVIVRHNGFAHSLLQLVRVTEPCVDLKATHGYG